MSNEAVTLYPVLVKSNKLSPFRRGWKWDAGADKYVRVWVTNWRPVYVKRVGKRLLKRLGPEPGFHKNLNASERKRVARWARARGWSAKLGDPVKVRRYPHLRGDVDVQEGLAQRLERVGRDLGKIVYIASGNRTYEEQAALYADYLAGRGPLAAAPGRSNHHGGKAADCWIDGGNIGNYPGARTALKNNGLCLPVRGESWHVEIGTTWRG